MSEIRPDEGAAPWPALMDEGTAAAYLALGRASLRRLLAREGVAPVRLGLRLRRWRRSDLDQLLERLPVLGVAGDSCASRDLGVSSALERVERRVGGRARKAPGER